MLSSKAPRSTATRLFAAGAVLTLGALSLSACGGSSPSTSSTGSASAEKVGVSLIVKTTTNPFFVSMQDGAKKAAEAGGVDLKLAAGKADGDEDTQIQAIENAISKGDKGILITPNGPSVVDALKKAKDAGLFVIALDTPPDPADAADITFATDNFAAGELIGKWTAAQLDGKKATIALVDLFDDKVVSVDYNRDQGFLTGPRHRHRGQEEERRRGQDRQVHRRQGRRLRDRRQPGLPGRRGRRTHRHGNPPRQEPEHQRRLHHQRTRSRGCLRGTEGRRQGKGRAGGFGGRRLHRA